MDAKKAKEAQCGLDDDTKALRQLIRSARRNATERCAAGDAANSAAYRRVEAYLTLAYAEGRTICISCDDGGVVTPQFGGS